MLIITNFSPEETKNSCSIVAGRKCQTVKPQKEKQQYQTRCSRRGNRGNYLRGRFHHLWPLFHQALQRAVCLQLGEYIDDSVIEQFREETGIEVTYDLFETNEEMYPVIEAGAVNYDVVCPSDYMIQKMAETAFWLKSTLTTFRTLLISIRSSWKCQGSLIRRIFTPYTVYLGNRRYSL